MKPDFMEARAFVTILETGSFAQAARRLGLSPSRISELLRSFEERLQVRLIERTTRSVSPTLAGEMLLARLTPLLDEFVGALESTREFHGKVSGLLRLTAAPPAADLLLEPRISAFLRAYPQVSIEVSVDGGLVDIVAGRFDAGIRFGELVEKDMIAARISDDIPFVVVAAPSYLAENGSPDDPRDLARHCCFNVRLPGGAILPWRFQRDSKVYETRFDGRLTANTTSMQVRAAVEGLGLFQTPRTMVAAELEDGRLVTVLDEWAPPPLGGFHLYYPSRRQTRPALRALVDFLRQQKR